MEEAQKSRVDTVLRLLARPRCRLVLDHIQHASTASVRTLASYIDDQYDASRGLEHEKILLYHDVLPMLDEHGLIAYDCQTNVVCDRSCSLVDRILAIVEEWESER